MHSLSPGDGVEPGGPPAAVGVDLPALAFGATAGVDGHDDALGAELARQSLDQARCGDGGGVHGHLVRPGPKQGPAVRHRSHPAADGEGDEDLLGGSFHDVHHGGPVVRGGGDVQEHELVGALGVIAGGELQPGRRRRGAA